MKAKSLRTLPYCRAIVPQVEQYIKAYGLRTLPYCRAIVLLALVGLQVFES